MIFYILLPDEKKENLVYDANQLGETSGKNFYINKGFTRLSRIIDENPELLENIEIFDDTEKEYTVSSFLKVIEKYNILFNN